MNPIKTTIMCYHSSGISKHNFKIIKNDNSITIPQNYKLNSSNNLLE